MMTTTTTTTTTTTQQQQQHNNNNNTTTTTTQQQQQHNNNNNTMRCCIRVMSVIDYLMSSSSNCSFCNAFVFFYFYMCNLSCKKAISNVFCVTRGLLWSSGK